MNSNVNYQVLSRVPAFQGFSGDEIAALTEIATKCQVRPGQTVIQEGDPADCFYLLCSGELEVVSDQGGRQTPIAQLGPGQLIGEMPLVFKQKIRQASVLAVTNSSLLRFAYQEYEELSLVRPELGEKVKANLGRIAKSRHTDPLDSPRISSLLTECRIFQGLSPEHLESIARIAVPTEAPAESTVVKIDEPADRFFLLVSGQVEVLVLKGGRFESLTRLGKGQIFGEMTLIYHQPMRFASVVAVVDTQLLAFPFEGFQELAERQPDLGEAIASNLQQLAASRSWVLENE
jgi:CRP-like cAMP-binding protein